MTGTKALAPFELKAADSDTRTFEGLASTWDLDLGGDVIHQGAFSKTLKEWKSSGRVIPLIDQHQYWSVRHVLGKLVDAKETDDGLWTQWKVTEGEDGDELLHRMRGGMVDGLSIGYESVKADWEENQDKTEKRVRHIRELKLVEVSVVIWGMNPNALVDTRSVKSLLDGVEPVDLSDDDRKELRALASRIGALLRPPADPDKADPPADNGSKPIPPEATPSAEADSQKAEDGPTEPAAPAWMVEALEQRLGRIL